MLTMSRIQQLRKRLTTYYRSWVRSGYKYLPVAGGHFMGEIISELDEAWSTAHECERLEGRVKTAFALLQELRQHLEDSRPHYPVPMKVDELLQKIDKWIPSANTSA